MGLRLWAWGAPRFAGLCEPARPQPLGKWLVVPLWPPGNGVEAPRGPRCRRRCGTLRTLPLARVPNTGGAPRRAAGCTARQIGVNCKDVPIAGLHALRHLSPLPPRPREHGGRRQAAGVAQHEGSQAPCVCIAGSTVVALHAKPSCVLSSRGFGLLWRRQPHRGAISRAATPSGGRQPQCGSCRPSLPLLTGLRDEEAQLVTSCNWAARLSIHAPDARSQTLRTLRPQRRRHSPSACNCISARQDGPRCPWCLHTTLCDTTPSAPSPASWERARGDGAAEILRLAACCPRFCCHRAGPKADPQQGNSAAGQQQQPGEICSGVSSCRRRRRRQRPRCAFASS